MTANDMSGDRRLRHREDDLVDDGRADLPPPPPTAAPLDRDSEQRIRDDERDRVRRELEDLADDRHERGAGVVDPDRVDHRERERTRYEETVRERAFSAGQALTMLVGAALVVLGIVALAATGIDTPLDQPTEEVIGFNHTPWLGIGEVGAGALLLLAGLRPGGRWLAVLIGLGLVVVGAMFIVEMDWTIEELDGEQSYGWIPVGAGALAIIGGLMTPRRSRRVVDTEYVRDDVRDDQPVR